MKTHNFNSVEITIENAQKFVLTTNNTETYQRISGIIINGLLSIKPQDNMVDAMDYFGIDDINEEGPSIVFTDHLSVALSFLFQRNIISESYKNELIKQLNEKKWEEKKTPTSLLFNEKQPSSPYKKEQPTSPILPSVKIK
jgi:hypothetical protein